MYMRIISYSLQEFNPFLVCTKSTGQRMLPGAERVDYFFAAFMCSLTIFKISSGVSTGLEISFLGQTAAHRPQEVQME